MKLNNKKCICIKNGLGSGGQFCYEGKVYNYTCYEKRCYEKRYYPYTVNTDGPGAQINYSMSYEFFSTYFVPINEILDEELFEI